MANPTPEIKHTYAEAKPPLSEFARFAAEGLYGEESTYRYVKANGPEAARQLLRFLTDLPGTVGCTSIEQFLMGYASREDEPEGARLKDWENLLAKAFTLAKIEDLEGEFAGDGTRAFAEQMFPLLRDIAVIASPPLVAWGKPTRARQATG